MEYELFLKYKAKWDFNINKDPEKVCQDTLIDIFLEADKSVPYVSEYEKPKDMKIGFLLMKHYNQAEAMSYGVDTTSIRTLTSMNNSEALLKLDQSLITRDTIAEIGAVTNPTIILLIHFGISAAWRNRGFGEKVMKALIAQMIGQCGYMVVLNSQPQQHADYNSSDSLYTAHGVELTGLEENPDKAQWKLNAFWQRCGFKQFKNYDDVFICNVEQEAPLIWKDNETPYFDN
jgi:hypothetical protein